MRRLTTVFALVAVLAMTMSPASAVESDSPMPSAAFNSDVRAVAYDGDRVFVGGDFSSSRTTNGSYFNRNYLAAVNSSNGNLLGFNPSVDGRVLALETHQGYLYASGEFRRVNGVSMPRLARFDLETGELDEDFRVVPSALVYGLKGSGDRLYVGGQFASIDGVQQPRLAAIDLTDNSVDTDFRPVVNGGSVRDVDAAHGRVYLSGAFLAMEGNGRWATLAAVDPDTGNLDRSFDPQVRALIRKIAIGGDTIYATLDARGGTLNAIDLDGKTKWYSATDGGIQAVAVSGDTVMIGGHFEEVCVDRRSGPRGECVNGTLADRRKLYAVDTDGELLPFHPDADSVVGVWDIKPHPSNGSFAVGGAFMTFNQGQVFQRGLALFN
ncbi:hypothetical protein [Natronoglycomyces albus]|uniref:Uncharacterized protein n=1 Tax=Natronoglycomyces albus TaxID=2811108 RepID=A0A895XL62_9ACTN|nr:hypothetical protein [Natronoglycomyces albus]QSB04293.1 hypothetical protein JQS30_10830 [Natronoglycomyces albus]